MQRPRAVPGTGSTAGSGGQGSDLHKGAFQVEKEGIYYGQCNQICGTDHAYMPIAIEAVSKAKFQQWLDEAKKKFAADEPARPVRVAAAD